MPQVNVELKSSERSSGSRGSGCLAVELSGGDGCAVGEACWADAVRVDKARTRVKKIMRTKSVTSMYFTGRLRIMKTPSLFGVKINSRLRLRQPQRRTLPASCSTRRYWSSDRSPDPS